MRLPSSLIFAASLLTACGPEASTDHDPVSFCSSDLAYRYDPVEELTTWPDDWWAVTDDSTATGLRLSLDPDDPALDEFPAEYDNLIVSMGQLDGFGTTPGLIAELRGLLPSDLGTLEAVLLTQSADGAWTPHETSLSAIDAHTLQVRPWRPLPPASRGVLAVRSELTDGSDCIAPSETLQGLLTDPGQPLYSRYQEGLGALGWSPGDVGIMTVFTTQSAGRQEAEIIADVDARTHTLDGPMDCAAGDDYRRCDGTVTVGDYRAPETGTVPADAPVTVHGTYALPVRLWLPDDDGAAAPYPVVMCGHGLAGSKSQCGFLGALAAPLGVAVAAVDAIEHGEHPARTQDGPEFDVIMAMCGFTLTPPSFDALQLRDNFRQSAWDKLQVLRAIQAGWDVDGDGTADLDGERVQYMGVSLGGIMGPQLLAAAPEIDAGVLFVPGGGLMELFIDSDSFGIIALALTPGDWEHEDLLRIVPMVQALVDAGDPLVFSAQMSARRRAGDPQAHVALMMAYEDAIVPNTSTERLAQALEVENIGEELVAIPGVPRVDGPVSGNLPDGATGGLLQFDRTQAYEGANWDDAQHAYLHQSVQGIDVIEPLMLTVIEGGVPTLAEPYSDDE